MTAETNKDKRSGRSHRGRNSSPTFVSSTFRSLAQSGGRAPKAKGVRTMQIHLDAALLTLGQIDAVVNAIDEIYMDDADSRLQYLVSILPDLVSKLNETLELIQQDKLVVDAIYAANDVRRRCTLKTDK